ncbi:CTLH/CRA C-terminal to lish motif domain-containing protein [Mrakia frigida]|uniref:glucose-induced degradation complex subunit GID8 n=1 Tax=Mrakia frigida TaxID=29902 RepID=UPI003FCC0360
MANNQQQHQPSSSSKKKLSSSASGGPTGDEWARRLAEVDLSKSDLNRLVLDYLIVEGYQTAAEEFVRESGVLDSSSDDAAGGGGDEKMDDGEGSSGGNKKASFDLDGIQERMSIRKAVESGRVEEAIRRVNELDSDILDLHPHLIFHLHLLHLYELLLSSPSQPTTNGSNPSNNLSSTLLFASETLAPLALSSPSHLAELEDALSLLLVLPGATNSSANVGGGGGLTKQQRREKVAKELNAAILEGQGRGCESKLVGVWRCLKWGEGELIGAGGKK